MKKKFIFLMIPFLSLVLFSFGGGGGSGGGKKGPFTDGNTSTPCDLETIKLILYQGNINVNNIPERDPSWGTFEKATNNIFNSQHKSASSLYEDINYKNYCFITITSTSCSNYGSNGTKTYLWDSTNDGQLYDGAMNIQVPSDKNFTISIDLHESCGDYYTGTNYKRAMWVHQQTYNPGASSIGISTWSFNRLNNCN
jgi:hypothetical protein